VFEFKEHPLLFDYEEAFSKLNVLKKMLDSGLITEEEYQDKKSETIINILGSLVNLHGKAGACGRFRHFYACWQPKAQLFNMRDDANHTASDRQVFNSTSGCVERFQVQGAEAFINKEAVELCGASGLLYLVAQLQSESQGRKEGFSPTQGVRAPQLPGVVVVNDVKGLIPRAP